MAELIVDFITSLDGFGAADGWPGFWGLEAPEYLAWLDQLPDRSHTLLMGATTYRLMSSFADGTIETRDAEKDAIDELSAATKVVFSSTLEAPLTWGSCRLVRTDAAAEVRAMLDAGVSLRTLGSVSLCRSLLTAGLVDRVRVGVFPVINGATGRDRIYDGYPDVSLQLVQSRTFDGAIQVLEYVPTVLDAPPAAGLG
ncbi:dihydrofolate reductase family protein [uncultured Cellulomonas sp.]|uniref:dihydrofolate reductase family protein n=1 Tax=uncultured Cellulomonas sp. TaxID=189682 RepID=UPI0028E9EA8E|nr:dihydrofolate reductase family protein [uncultured Cellulomonas sp.]